jgi:uncharacterized membrane protein
MGAVLWAACVVTAPRLVSTATPASPAWPAFLAVYAVGGSLCHQDDARSFHTAGLRWPVCARCAGLYVSTGLAALVLLLAPARWTHMGDMGSRLKPILLLAAAPTIVSWGAERLGVIAPGNVVRAGLAAPLGIAVAAFVAQAWRTAAKATGID